MVKRGGMKRTFHSRALAAATVSTGPRCSFKPTATTKSRYSNAMDRYPVKGFTRKERAVTSATEIAAKTNSLIGMWIPAGFSVTRSLSTCSRSFAGKASGFSSSLPNITTSYPFSSRLPSLVQRARFERKRLTCHCPVLGAENADRQDHHLQSLELEPLLQGMGRVVVEQAGQEVLLLENQFSGKEDRSRKFPGDGTAQLLQFRHEIDPERVTVLRMPAETVGKVDEALEVFFLCAAQILDLAETFESAGVDHPHGDKDHVVEVAREQPGEAQQRVK